MRAHVVCLAWLTISYNPTLQAQALIGELAIYTIEYTAPSVSIS